MDADGSRWAGGGQGRRNSFSIHSLCPMLNNGPALCQEVHTFIDDVAIVGVRVDAVGVGDDGNVGQCTGGRSIGVGLSVVESVGPLLDLVLTVGRR